MLTNSQFFKFAIIVLSFSHPGMCETAHQIPLKFKSDPSAILPIYAFSSANGVLYTAKENEVSTGKQTGGNPQIGFHLLAQHGIGSVPVYQYKNKDGAPFYTYSTTKEEATILAQSKRELVGQIGYLFPTHPKGQGAQLRPGMMQILRLRHKLHKTPGYMSFKAEEKIGPESLPKDWELDEQKLLGYGPDPKWYDPATYQQIFLDEFGETNPANPNQCLYSTSKQFPKDRKINDNFFRDIDHNPRAGGFSNDTAICIGGNTLRFRYFSEKDGAKLNHYAGYANSFARYTYGYFEARIKFHDTDGVQSTFWLQSSGMQTKPFTAINDPENAGVEVDIIEHFASLVNGFTEQPVYAIHWNGYGEASQTLAKYKKYKTPTLQDSWHVYGLLWTPTSYTFYVDGEPEWSTSQVVSQSPQFIRINGEVKTNPPANGFGLHKDAVFGMDIDWVRVWKHK